MNLDFKHKVPFLTSELIVNSAVSLTLIAILLFVWCVATGLGQGWQFFAANVFQLDRDQSLQVLGLSMLVMHCVFLMRSMSKIENSGAALTDCSNSDVKAARKSFLYVLFISGLLFACSKGSLLSLIGLALMVLVLGLRAGFFFSTFRRNNDSRSYILVSTSLLFVVTVCWTYFLR